MLVRRAVPTPTAIGERQYLSRHTVKSHAMAIYRKLNVTSRDDAVQRAREVGLL
jgi:LuxR family transcriptional regulator, maltose regulon positive regulatory protein